MNSIESIRANIAARKALGMTATQYQSHLQRCETQENAERRRAIQNLIAATIRHDEGAEEYWLDECRRLGCLQKEH